MKFRPQIQLRFRDEEQYEEVKRKAFGESVSANEWLLRAIEFALPLHDKMNREAKGGNTVAKKASKHSDAVAEARQVVEATRPPIEPGSAPEVVAEPVKPKKEPKPEKLRGCSRCGENLIEWGTQLRCMKCERNEPK